MNNKKFIILITIALLFGGLAYFATKSKNTNSHTKTLGEPLLPELQDSKTLDRI